MKKKKKIIIIDANSIIHRAFHALPPLQTKDGTLVNAVYGFTTILLKALKDFKPDYICCCFDVDKNTFRKQEYAEYKGNRKEQPSELYHQFPLIKELLEAFKIPVYEKQGFEADDLLGTISAINEKKHPDIQNIIVTGDLDALQLVSPHTEVYTMKRGVSDTFIYTVQTVKDRYGFGPEGVIEYKALRGDTSDNIPGVRGVGEKTALALINEYKDLDGVYQEVEKYSDPKEFKGHKILKPSMWSKMIEHKKDAYLSKHLATIVQDVKIDYKLKDCEVESFDTQHVVQLFQMWNFNRLIAQIPQAEKIMKQKQGTLFSSTQEADNSIQGKEVFKMKDGYCLVKTKKDLKDFVKEIKKQEIIAVDTETTGLNTFQDKLLGIAFAWQEHKAYYLPVTLGLKIEEIKKILENPKVKKIGHNIKFDYEILEHFGIKMQGLYFDTMIASYLLNPGSRQHGLDALAFSELGYKMQSITDLTGETKKEKIDLSKIALEKVANYSCEDVDITFQLHYLLSEKLDDATISNVLEKIEMPLIYVLAEMEKNGIKIDVKFLQKMSKKLASKIKDLEKNIYKLAGTKFNVASPKQLKEILFEKMKISTQGLNKTKTGVSTAAGELEKLSSRGGFASGGKGQNEIIDYILEFRELSKLKNTYLDPLPELVDADDRVHTSFNQTITATGRLSSSNPNLQNIPIRSDLGKEIRKAFVAQSGYKIIAADYSQIELRIIASLSGDKNLLEAFNKQQDIHTQTASKIFNIKKDEVTKAQRRQAKTINFGIIYGQGPRGLALSAGITYDQAVDFINKYFEIFEGVKNYIEETIALTRELGYAETLFGRRRYLPEINAHHPQMRSSAERMAINHPVQGTAADLIKLAMINLHKRIRQEFVKGEAKMLLQVHDELVVEVREDLVEHAKKIIQHEMETVYKLKAPIDVDIDVGDSWGEAK